MSVGGAHLQNLILCSFMYSKIQILKIYLSKYSQVVSLTSQCKVGKPKDIYLCIKKFHLKYTYIAPESST